MELVSPQDRWVILGAVPGVRGRKVDALAWVCGGRAPPAATVAGAPPPPRRADKRWRLFGCSRNGTLFELDFSARRQTGVVGSGGRGVFCLVSLSARGGAGGGGHLAAGCEDGTVKIYAACGEDGGPTASGTPELAATLPGAGGAILLPVWVPGREGAWVLA